MNPGIVGMRWRIWLRHCIKRFDSRWCQWNFSLA